MGTSTDKGTASRLLHGLEYGGLTVSEARVLAEDLGPVLVHLIARYVREAYPASAPAAGPVLERLVELTRAWNGMAGASGAGERDPVSVWFAGEHRFADFRGRGDEMLDLVIDKLES